MESKTDISNLRLAVMKNEQRAKRKKQLQKQRMLSVLKVSLQLLAKPADVQSRYVPEYQVLSKAIVDRASLSWDFVRLTCPDELPEKTKQLLSQLIESVERMPANCWHEDAFKTGLEWAAIRQLAADTLASLESSESQLT
jgi:hypothetical protein